MILWSLNEAEVQVVNHASSRSYFDISLVQNRKQNFERVNRQIPKFGAKRALYCDPFKSNESCVVKGCNTETNFSAEYKLQSFVF